MSKNIIHSLLLSFGLMVALISCKEEDINDMTGDPGSFLSGIFVVNEGPFLDGSGSLSFYDRLEDEMRQNVFEKVNGNTVGNIAQSGTISGDNIFLVINNSDRIIMADAGLLTEKKRFEYNASSFPLSQPRYIVASNNGKVYVSQHGKTYENPTYVVPPSVLVIDYESDTYKLIETGKRPEKLVAFNSSLYVPNWGGIDGDSIVTIIDMMSDEVKSTLVVGDNPVHMAANESQLWVLCQGYTDFDPSGENDTDGALVQIINDTIATRIELPQGGDNLVIDESGSYLYYTLGGKVYRQATNSVSRETEPFIDQFYYSLGIDPNTGNIIGLNPVDFASNGKMTFHNAEDGSMIVEHETGIIPGELIYK